MNTCRRTKAVGILSCFLLFGILILPWHVHGQASSGFVKVGSVAFGTNTFTDTTVADGSTYIYQVTAANAAGESTPATSGAAVIPATGTHSVTATWGAPTSGGTPTSYNVYRFLLQVPGAPGSVGVTVN